MKFLLDVYLNLVQTFLSVNINYKTNNMSETTTTTVKKSLSNKKILIIITTILTLLGIGNHFTFKLGYTTADVTVSDSTLVIAASVETSTVTAIDTASLDTTKTNK